jgi:hypothetical protein
MNNVKGTIVIDTMSVIANLIEVDKRDYLPVYRLIKVVNHLYERLVVKDVLNGEYEIIFNVNFNLLERIVKYNDNYLQLVGDIIYFTKNIETVKGKWPLNQKVKDIISRFCASEKRKGH